MIFSRKAPESQLTLLQVLDQHYATYSNLGVPTLRRYRSELNRIENAVGAVPIRDYSIEIFTAFRAKCVEMGLRNSTTESSIKIAKAILRYCRDRGWLTALPHYGRPLKIAAPNPNPATVEEVEKLWEACIVATYPGRGILSPCSWWRAWFVFDWYAGLRIEDTFRVAPCHILEDEICFTASKTGSLHRWPMCDPVRWAVRTAIQGGWPTIFGQHHQNTLRNTLAEMCDHAGVRRLTFKNFRMACVTNWSKADGTAGSIVHGSGIPQIMMHYIGVVDLLREHLPKLEWPKQMQDLKYDVPEPSGHQRLAACDGGSE